MINSSDIFNNHKIVHKIRSNEVKTMKITKSVRYANIPIEI